MPSGSIVHYDNKYSILGAEIFTEADSGSSAAKLTAQGVSPAPVLSGASHADWPSAHIDVSTDEILEHAWASTCLGGLQEGHFWDEPRGKSITALFPGGFISSPKNVSVVVKVLEVMGMCATQ